MTITVYKNKTIYQTLKKTKSHNTIYESKMRKTKETFFGSKYVTLKVKEQHPALYLDLYINYMKLLQKTPFKEKYNKYSKTVKEDLTELIREHFLRNVPNPSEDYQCRVQDQIRKEIIQTKNFGAFPYSYKELGNSPRLIPVTYGKTINNAKRIVREYVYNVYS